MQTLNPSDNWVKDKGTSVDHEDDEETSETGNGQQLVEGGKSKKKVKYGHASLEKNNSEKNIEKKAPKKAEKMN